MRAGVLTQVEMNVNTLGSYDTCRALRGWFTLKMVAVLREKSVFDRGLTAKIIN